jgi:hypothetical protein
MARRSISGRYLDTSCPVYDKDGKQWTLQCILPSGALVFIDDNEFLLKVDNHGRRFNDRKQILFNEAPETVEFLSLYPDGSVYKKSCCPVSQSSYGLENLIQIKLTRRGDKIVGKEFC